ncbi:hypothetical protein EBQ10_07240 [Trueperella pyogenes]|uniref:Lipoprotein n=2 Tax=Trueperella pyogenes TaxID=1661 RepID=A0A3S9QMB7_9ACTO|nr:hypothetical protein EBQ10_07240 [Trueperella pyogenes]
MGKVNLSLEGLANMRSRIVASTSAIALVLLAACGGDAAPASPESSEEAAVDHCSDPLKTNSASINARELAFCQAEALGRLAGYVQEETVDGHLVKRSRANIRPLALEIESFSTKGAPAGRVILVKGNTFVQREDSWVQATADSSDETLAYQATLPARYEALLNPHMRAARTDPTFEYTVTGTTVINNTPVKVLTLTVADDSDSFVSTLFIREDYVVLRSESVYTVAGKKSTRAAVLTAVNEPQDIINPRFEDDEHRSDISQLS